MKKGSLNESSNNFLFHIFIRKNTDDAPSWLATAGKKKMIEFLTNKMKLLKLNLILTFICIQTLEFWQIEYLFLFTDSLQTDTNWYVYGIFYSPFWQ